ASQAHAAELEAARDDDRDLAEQLRAAQMTIVGLESEVQDLRDENARLKARIEELEGAPKRRGRPPGSKNKPKPDEPPAIVVTESGEPVPVDIAAVVHADGLDIPDYLKRPQ